MKLNTNKYRETDLNLLSACSTFRGESDRDKSVYLGLCKNNLKTLFNSDVTVYLTKGASEPSPKYIDDITGSYNTSKEVALKEDIRRINLELKGGVTYHIHSSDLGLFPVFDFSLAVKKSDKSFIGCTDAVSIFDAYILYTALQDLISSNLNKDYEIPIVLGRRIFTTIKDSCKILGSAEDRYWGNISFIVPDGRGREFIQELEDNDIYTDSYEDVVNIRLMHSHTYLDLRPFMQILKEYI